MSRSQREMPTTHYRKETFLNLCMLSKAKPMQPELSRLLFKENSLDKPTQNLFNHLSYYLATIVDAQGASKLTWPLYDSKAERAYRNELYIFVCNYSNKGLTPVMSSYFVNPSCHKVTVLIFQMSSLAIRTVITHIGNDCQKTIIKEVDDMKQKGCDKITFENMVEEKTQAIQFKLTDHLNKQKIIMDIASKLRTKIVENEKKVTEAQNFINNLVDNYIEHEKPNETTKQIILNIKNVKEDCSIFDDWLAYTDSQIIQLEEQYRKDFPFLELCQKTSDLTKIVVMRYTGQTEKSSYMISYNKSDKINTQDLERQVNVEQACVLKNLDFNGILNFPNLIRAFTIAIQFILKNIQVDNKIYDFTKYLQTGSMNYHEISLGLQSVMERISNAEQKIEYSPPSVPLPLPDGGFGDTYPGTLTGPSLSNLKAGTDCHAFFETFTPLIASKQKFSFYRTVSNLKQPLIMSLHPPKDDFMRSLISFNINSNNQISSNSNVSVVSHVKSNETIADCTSGFTKQQIQRLFSTKKTSSSKKYKYSSERPANVKSTALNYDSGVSVESCALTRSYSSPNLYENRERRSIPRTRGRKLSIMKENSPLELSGISVLDNNSNFSTPGIANAESTIKIIISNAELDLKDLSKETTTSARQSIESMGTPKMNTHLIKKTSSIEKIINRFKKVRASVIPTKESFIEQEEKCIEEEKVMRSILPDLISPSLSFTEESRTSFESDVQKNTRESLGTALGVDQTFLDQFDLID
ncbi:uncharacterized protein LOC123714348 [Pieris brassicae]|uniref:HAUS augmin-like complex subunit 6 N-terminal domain-containing protein n=1 Tax=Pieris brassicae TaxID=7116 RepID=A0A9P0TV16_PIEBR|nr:uncharacterized protein LOC123714348 [Pieris brassicae]CAH4035319.1 unnamed protein product [Pieris brassicae]